MPLVRNDKVKWSTIIDGEPVGDWMTATEVSIDTSEKKIRPAATAPIIAIGGSSIPSNLTLVRPFFPELDPAGKRFDQVVRSVSVKAIGQPLDKNNNVNGDALTVSGTMKQWSVSPADANGNDEAQVTMEISVDTVS